MGLSNDHFLPDEPEPPNTDLVCNLCEKTITSYCMLSHDTGLLSMMESSVLSLRKHFKEEHSCENPDPRFTMCTYCHKISEFDKEKQQWKDCNHTI